MKRGLSSKNLLFFSGMKKRLNQRIFPLFSRTKKRGLMEITISRIFWFVFAVILIVGVTMLAKFLIRLGG